MAVYEGAQTVDSLLMAEEDSSACGVMVGPAICFAISDSP